MFFFNFINLKMNNTNPIVILAANRTPMGDFQGSLASLTATDLGAKSIAYTLKQLSNPVTIDEVYMGCVLSAGLGQAPARQATLKAGLPHLTLTNTINKVCGSGMKSIMLGADTLRTQQANFIIAGGMESMSNTPYLLPKARQGLRLGHGKTLDHLFTDGLEDAYQTGTLMGLFAEQCADKYQFSRAQQDEFALASLEKALLAQNTGKFQPEIAPVEMTNRHGSTVINSDEAPKTARPDKIPQLKPAFKADGTVTAANASSISDGAASLLLSRADTAKQQGLTPIATIKGYASHAHTPEWFTTAPVGAINKLLKQLNWTVDEVDLFEINEAFAVVTLAAMQELNLPAKKVNVHGGACALGHPLGASGARIVTTLIHALHQQDKRKGIAAICIGGGEACAIAIEINH